jgi:hypothetical protein
MSEYYKLDNFPTALFQIASEPMHTTPPPARLQGAPPSNRQLAAAGLPVRAPRFNLVRAPI